MALAYSPGSTPPDLLPQMSMSEAGESERPANKQRFVRQHGQSAASASAGPQPTAPAEAEAALEAALEAVARPRPQA